MPNQQQTTFTIAESAKLYGLDRTTVFQHSKKKNGLSTHKEKRGQREVTVVDLSELIRFYGEIPDSKNEAQTTTRKADVTQDNNLVFQVALLEEKLKLQLELAERDKQHYQQSLKQLEAERNRAIEQASAWQQQAENSQKLLTDEREKSRPKRRWWQFKE
ncbi:MAG: hypothetical protein ACPGUE_21255 [Marinomonas sp.]